MKKENLGPFSLLSNLAPYRTPYTYQGMSTSGVGVWSAEVVLSLSEVCRV